jgi:hypothetical protein
MGNYELGMEKGHQNLSQISARFVTVRVSICNKYLLYLLQNN